MIPTHRKAFNEQFTEEKYQQFLDILNRKYKYKIDFRIAETPVFLPDGLLKKLKKAGEDIIDVIVEDGFKSKTDKAIPAHQLVPGEEGHTDFLAIDFAICKDKNGELEPQLIELQGFPSLYAYQDILAHTYKAVYDLDPGLTHLFGGLTSEQYKSILADHLLGGHKPEHVVLLEIEPYKQKTAIDFYATQDLAGITPVCISEVIIEGRNLYYIKDGKKIQIKRIYNRVIFDELQTRDDLKRSFNLTEDVDVEWAGHPNWYFRISKYIMPLLKGPYIPATYYLNELKEIPGDLENYVLKPLFSFAGSGVIFNLKREDIDNIKDKENYILQRKVKYEPVIDSPDGGVKTEIRLLYIWERNAPRPRLVVNIARLSKGEMIGVRFNHNKTWVGGGIAMFQKE